jgi:hypothetical protein
MPSNIFCIDNLEENQHVMIIGSMIKDGNVIVAVDKLLCKSTRIAFQDRTVSSCINGVMQATSVEELVIEGGATASAIIEKLNYRDFFCK